MIFFLIKYQLFHGGVKVQTQLAVVARTLLFKTCGNHNKTRVVRVNYFAVIKTIANLVNKKSIQIEEITKNGIAKLTTKHNSYLGTFCLQNNLPAYYNLIKCDDKNYIVVFGFGEVQAGRNILYISGIWEISD